MNANPLVSPSDHKISYRLYKNSNRLFSYIRKHFRLLGLSGLNMNSNSNAKFWPRGLIPNIIREEMQAVVSENDQIAV